MVTIFCYLGLAGTLYMTGVVWFAQLVHYPLLDRGNAEDYLAFAVAYQRRTLWVVVPGLSCEILGTLGLVWYWPSLQAWTGLGVLLAIWTVTCAVLTPKTPAAQAGVIRVRTTGCWFVTTCRGRCCGRSGQQ
ncbi:MAG: hypothetical protein Ct9H300mP1_19460 [Planctomycetaceae bacterium]|nr:MAG: hypothetical protein Ct9H300mP1_19460 [Planctomycetaceae bacterium]